MIQRLNDLFNVVSPLCTFEEVETAEFDKKADGEGKEEQGVESIDCWHTEKIGDYPGG